MERPVPSSPLRLGRRWRIREGARWRGAAFGHPAWHQRRANPQRLDERTMADWGSGANWAGLRARR
jgi:hypothetical protein